MADATATILALDASSTTIGWCILAGETVTRFGEIRLNQRDINDRCCMAAAQIDILLAAHREIDVVAIESPVARFPKAIIPQAFVSGAIRTASRRAGLHVVDVTPAEAKQALSGRGDAGKGVMQEWASAYGVTGEHAADAVGIALAAAGKVQVTR